MNYSLYQKSYFLKSRDPDQAAVCVKEVMKNGYKGEADLFIARTYLDFLARCDTPETARRFRKNFENVPVTPLLRFVGMLDELIDIGDFELLKQTKESYEQEIARDQSFIQVSFLTESFK